MGNIISIKRPIPQIPQCIRHVSCNVSFCNRNVYTCAHFCYAMAHCGIGYWCIVGFVLRVYEKDPVLHVLTGKKEVHSNWPQYHNGQQPESPKIPEVHWLFLINIWLIHNENIVHYKTTVLSWLPGTVIAPCWPHEPCQQGLLLTCVWMWVIQICIDMTQFSITLSYIPRSSWGTGSHGSWAENHYLPVRNVTLAISLCQKLS